MEGQVAVAENLGQQSRTDRFAGMHGHDGATAIKLISKVSVDHFRPIKSDEIPSLTEFARLAGLNNSGK